MVVSNVFVFMCLALRNALYCPVLLCLFLFGGLIYTRSHTKRQLVSLM